MNRPRPAPNTNMPAQAGRQALRIRTRIRWPRRVSRRGQAQRHADHADRDATPSDGSSAMPTGASRPIATGIRASFSPVTLDAVVPDRSSNAYDEQKEHGVEQGITQCHAQNPGGEIRRTRNKAELDEGPTGCLALAPARTGPGTRPRLPRRAIIGDETRGHTESWFSASTASSQRRHQQHVRPASRGVPAPTGSPDARQDQPAQHDVARKPRRAPTTQKIQRQPSAVEQQAARRQDRR